MAEEIDGTGGAGEYEWEEQSDFALLSEGEPRERLKGSAEEERAVIYRSRVLQGRIDLILLGGSAEKGRGDPEGAS